MNVLILSTKTGQGHNSASKALKQALEERGCSALVCDILKTGEKDASSSVSSLYNYLVTYHPGVFGFLYHAGEIISSEKHHSPIYYLNTIYSKKLLQLIERVKPDIIVCPHIFSGQAVTRLKQTQKITIPAVGIITDYTCSPFWEETRLEAYIIAAEGLRKEFIDKKVPAEKIYPLGIPVDRCFQSKEDPKTAKEAFGIVRDQVILVMGGSMGCGRLDETAKAISSKIPEALVVVACGSNNELFQKLTGLEGILPLQYISNLHLLMDAADVLITKPGGLSSTEAMAKRIPIVFANPIPGGEMRNAEFLSSQGMAVCAPDAEKTAQWAQRLLQDEGLRNKMIEAQIRFCNAHADRDIAQLLITLCGKENLL